MIARRLVIITVRRRVIIKIPNKSTSEELAKRA